MFPSKAKQDLGEHNLPFCQMSQIGDELDVLRPAATGISCRTKDSWLAEHGLSRQLNTGNGSGNALVTGKRLLRAKDVVQRAHSYQS